MKQYLCKCCNQPAIHTKQDSGSLGTWRCSRTGKKVPVYRARREEEGIYKEEIKHV